MSAIKEFYNLFRENPKVVVTTIIGMGGGAVLGAIAFYQNWLG